MVTSSRSGLSPIVLTDEIKPEEFNLKTADHSKKPQVLIDWRNSGEDHEKDIIKGKVQVVGTHRDLPCALLYNNQDGMEMLSRPLNLYSSAGSG